MGEADGETAELDSGDVPDEQQAGVTAPAGDDAAALAAARTRIVAKYGPWTAHNIRLPGDLYTIGDSVAGDELKLRRVVQVVADLAGRPFDELRVLDLACLEGLYSIELGLRGAQVVAIEGRKANIEKARFAGSALGLDNVEFIHGDVRDFGHERLGAFDVVLGLGILYHLDAPDVFTVVERIGDMCTRLAVFDTHVALHARETRIHRGRAYRGVRFVEHSAHAAPEERERSAWASLDNPTSFWPTRPSLLRLLAGAGFTTVAECGIPAQPAQPRDRVTLVAVKGAPLDLASTPLVAAGEGVGDVPERSGVAPLVTQTHVFQLVRRLALDARTRIRARSPD